MGKKEKKFKSIKDMNTADTIKQLLKEYNMPQSTLACRADLSEQTLTNILNGKTTAADSTIKQIASALNTDP